MDVTDGGSADHGNPLVVCVLPKSHLHNGGHGRWKLVAHVQRRDITVRLQSPAAGANTIFERLSDIIVAFVPFVVKTFVYDSEIHRYDAM
jgi:hypothetical protein